MTKSSQVVGGSSGGQGQRSKVRVHPEARVHPEVGGQLEVRGESLGRPEFIYKEGDSNRTIYFERPNPKLGAMAGSLTTSRTESQMITKHRVRKI